MECVEDCCEQFLFVCDAVRTAEFARKLLVLIVYDITIRIKVIKIKALFMVLSLTNWRTIVNQLSKATAHFVSTMSICRLCER